MNCFVKEINWLMKDEGINVYDVMVSIGYVGLFDIEFVLFVYMDDVCWFLMVLLSFFINEFWKCKIKLNKFINYCR